MLYLLYSAFVLAVPSLLLLTQRDSLPSIAPSMATLPASLVHRVPAGAFVDGALSLTRWLLCWE
jgi:hypothetical protein